MATVNKNFRIKNGLIVEGGTATVNGFGVLTKAQADQDYIVGLIGGTATSANEANKVVKRDASGNFAAGTITATFVGNVTGTVSSLSNHDTDDLAEGANLYFTNARALSATSAAYDAAGSAAGAQSAAIAAAASDATSKVAAEAALRVSGDAASVATAAADATSKVAAEAALRVSGDAASVATAAADATTKAATAKSEAIAAAASDATTKAATAKSEAIAAAASAAGTAISTAIATEVSDRNTAINSAVSVLTTGAPELLDTLNELAAAINDDANYASTMTTALAAKAPLASPALTGTPTAPTAAADTNTTQIATTAFAKAEADAAQTAAEATAAADATSKVAAEAALRVSGDAASVATAAADATSKVAAEAALRVSGDAASVATAAADATAKANAAQAAAEATAAAANTAQQNGTTAFTAINYNSVAKQVAATTGNIAVAAETTAIAWIATDYRSAKLVVKVKNGVHTQVSDLVVTLDTANNVAVSEYGITYSNGTELAAVTADYSGTDVRIRVTPANANTEVVVVGTLIK
jgi:spore coat polysaccharide biosynthesis protein SpsF (cytidylyltransferase family)